MTNKEITPERIQQEYDKGHEYKSGLNLYEQVKTCERFYEGDQWAGVKTKQVRPITVNFIRQIAHYKIAQIVSDDVGQDIEPFLPDEVAEQAAEYAFVTQFDGGDVAEQSRYVLEPLFFGDARVLGVYLAALRLFVLGGRAQVLREVPALREGVARADVDVGQRPVRRRLERGIEHARVVELLIYDGVEHLRYILISLLTRAVLDILIPVLRHALAGKSLGEIFIRFAFYKFHKMHLAFKYAASGGEKYVVKSPEYVKNLRQMLDKRSARGV